ncbi:hypothetical protein CASFOL_002793 [Castilleja foliolosa]|uniref:Uncharacterized protein n=1 Tax=Castilleja foliolosa TaxID=1961234 RepID=A0ABD3EFQ9_9LAMI
MIPNSKSFLHTTHCEGLDGRFGGRRSTVPILIVFSQLLDQLFKSVVVGGSGVGMGFEFGNELLMVVVGGGKEAEGLGTSEELENSGELGGFCGVDCWSVVAV